LWAARVNPKTQARVGRTIDLAVDTSGLHYFDKDSGLAIGHPDATQGNGSGRAALRSVQSPRGLCLWSVRGRALGPGQQLLDECRHRTTTWGPHFSDGDEGLRGR